MILIEIGNSSVKAVKNDDGQRSPLFKIGSDNIDGLRQELTNIQKGETVVLSSVRRDLTEVVLEFSSRKWS